VRRSGDVAAALRDAAGALAAVSDTARLDAELLMAHALGATRSNLLLRHMRDPEPPAFAALVARRLEHEPVAYIVGRQEFYGLDLAVTPAVLIPRGDSETLIDAARAAFAAGPPRRILDLGTGSGALLVAALSLWPKAEGLGIDRSDAALAVAAGNAAVHGQAGRARFIAGDWTKPGWADDLGTYDLILANPPYVETGAEIARQVRDHEPAGALFAGADGLDDYRILIPQLPALLASEGLAVIEIGHTQDSAVSRIASASGLAATLRHDLAGHPRALELRRDGDISLGNGACGH